MKSGMIKRIIVLILAVALLISSIFIIRSCSAPPKYEEIEARFQESQQIFQQELQQVVFLLIRDIVFMLII